MLNNFMPGLDSLQMSSSAMSGLAPINTGFETGDVYFKSTPTHTQAVNQLPFIIGIVIVGALVLKGKI